MIALGYAIVLLGLAYFIGKSNTARYHKIIIQQEQEIEQLKRINKETIVLHTKEMSELSRRE